jgi:site-specific DNA-cytosine methylase
VFLENVIGIVNNGVRVVAPALLEAGYNIVQTVVSAEESGAPHVRRRWFCMAVKSGYKELLVRKATQPKYEFTWKGAEPVPRLIPKITIRKSYYNMWKIIGNTVVPSSVQHAWDLCQRAHNGQLERFPNKKHKQANLCLQETARRQCATHEAQLEAQGILCNTCARS